jgi:hypothetical protein
MKRAAEIDPTYYGDLARFYWYEMGNIDDAARKSLICMRRAVMGYRSKDESALIWNMSLDQSLFQKFKNILDFPKSPNYIQILKSMGGHDLLAYHVAMINDPKFLQKELEKDELDDKQIKIIITRLCVPEESELMGSDQIFTHLLAILKKDESYLDLVLNAMDAEQKYSFASFVRGEGSWMSLAETVLSSIQTDEITDLETKLSIQMEAINARFYAQLANVSDLNAYVSQPTGRLHYRVLYREYKSEFNKWMSSYIELKRSEVEIDKRRQAEFDLFAQNWNQIQMRNSVIKKAEAKQAKQQFADLISNMQFHVDNPDPKEAAARAAAKRANGKTEADA